MDNKRFEEWIPVDCNECGRYWDSSCDGVKCKTNSDKALSGSTRLCNSFIATRRVVIPAQIKRLERRVRALEVATAVIVGVIILFAIEYILGG